MSTSPIALWTQWQIWPYRNHHDRVMQWLRFNACAIRHNCGYMPILFTVRMDRWLGREPGSRDEFGRFWRMGSGRGFWRFVCVHLSWYKINLSQIFCTQFSGRFNPSIRRVDRNMTHEHLWTTHSLSRQLTLNSEWVIQDVEDKNSKKLSIVGRR